MPTSAPQSLITCAANRTTADDRIVVRDRHAARLRHGVAVVLQVVKVALEISHRLYIMGHGRVVFEGAPADLAGNTAVTKEWLEV